MKRLASIIILFFTIVLIGCQEQEKKQEKTTAIERKTAMDSLLRHVVLFKFNDSTSTEKLKEIEDAFSDLPNKIKEIKDYEWGVNNSPEGLDNGLTHCFFVTFYSEEDRDAYLPHPDHQAFVAIASPYIEDVTVIDYWTK